MPTKKTRKNVVLLSEVRADRMLAEIRQTFTGDGPSVEDAKALAVRVAEQLRILPPNRRRILRTRLAVAVHDLEDLVAALENELSALADDLRAVNRHGDASSAYGRSARIGTKHV